MRPVTTTLAFVLLLALAACGPDPGQAPSRERTDAPAEQPLFATDEEALAAAEEVYREYSAAADKAGEIGDPTLVEPFVTAEWFEQEVATYEDLSVSGRRLVGDSLIGSMRLQSIDKNLITAYVCHQTTGVRVIDIATGSDVTPANRLAEATLEVSFESVEDRLLIAGSELWSSSC